MIDAAVRALSAAETRRQATTLTLIPSENHVSGEVLRAVGTRFTDKYAEGYPGRRYYAGNAIADQLERLTQERALALFGLNPDEWHVNVQAHSGSGANAAAYTALVPPGGTIMGLRLDMGGHLTHGAAPSTTSRFWKSSLYELDPRTHLINFAALTRQARLIKPSVLVAGFTAYPRLVDFSKFSKVAHTAKSLLIADISHIAGLVAGGSHPAPFPHADLVTMTTHKTLRGPRSALIFCRKSYAKVLDRAVFPGLQGGPHLQQIAGVAVALREAAQPSFKRYSQQVIHNARVLGQELQRYGFDLVSGGTDTHLLLIDLRKRGIAGAEAAERLETSGLITNKNAIPFDPAPPTKPSGLRIGTPAVTTRGMGPREMRQVARLIQVALSTSASVRTDVRALARRFPLPR